MLWSLFAGFARVGLFGFGGGPSMIPLMQAECVQAGWVTDEVFLDGLAMGNALPGPIATKMAVYVGYEAYGPLGAGAALLGVILPSVTLMALLTSVLMQFRSHPAVQGALAAARPVVVGMLAFVVFELGPKGVQGTATAVLAMLAFGLLVAKVHPALVIGGAAAFGAVFWRA